jgi:hypothetical protein
MTRPIRPRGRRGYMLLEVAIGGAVTAVILATVFNQLAAARVRSITAARDVTAAQLVTEKIEEMRQAAVPAAATETVAGVSGTYTRTVVVATGTETMGATTLSYTDVAVTVSFPSNDGRNHTFSATLRRYP